MWQFAVCDYRLVFTCFPVGSGEDEDVIRVADDADALFFHRLVKIIQIDVGEQGGRSLLPADCQFMPLRVCPFLARLRPSSRRLPRTF